MPKKSTSTRLTGLLVNLQSRLGEPIDLAEMARQFGTSPFHFHRLFCETTGETPRQYIERLRLERAALMLGMRDDSVESIAKTVGFEHHATFTRSFKRCFGKTPSQIRVSAEKKKAEALEAAKKPIEGNYCVSDVRFETLRPGFLLAKRRVGDYTKYTNAPFAKTDRYWNPLVRWAARHKIPHEKIGWGLSYDGAGLTPPESQRFDACVRIENAVTTTGDIQCLRFAGGLYAVVEHTGPESTLAAAYRKLFHAAILAPDQYIWREGPGVNIYQEVHADKPHLNRTKLCFAVTKLHRSKKRQIRPSNHR